MVESYQDFDFPAELRCQPQCLVAFIGLDYANNTAHKNIWEMFSQNRHQDRVPIEFIPFSIECPLPIQKPKRTLYEWYIPKGVLKTNWMNKHLRLIPSVIVLFYELDWDDPHWSEKKLECAAHIHSIKSAIEGRSIKIALVLIQKSPVIVNSGPDDSLSTERASELCTTCDLNPKLLLLLHHHEHLQGYIVRLESVFYELAQSYYTQEIRNVKLHKDHLVKTSHQYLFVRHQFKIAFFNEMKRDLNTAHKHYTLANSNLLELRMTDANINEIKIVASFITYKLCKIYFALNQPRDAISQFNTHIDRFRGKTGLTELLFEHYIWLSKQFAVFGDLFEEAARQGLPAVQARHPGFYYEQAAQYASQRKKLTNDMCKEPIQYPENDPLIGWDKIEFYGQRPWRLVNRTEQFDAVREQLAVLALQYREKFIVDHSAMIISYLGNAIGQFKLYRSPRKRRYLAVQMADEYYSSKDYGKALTLFTHMLWEYRNDKWLELTVDLLKKALICAYLTASLQEYTELCVEGLYLFPNEEKLRILNNVTAIIQKTNPQSEPFLSEAETPKATELWSNLVQSSSVKFLNVDMHPNTSFVYCKATFSQSDSDSVSVEIWLSNEFPFELQFSQLSIGIASPSRNTEFFVIKEREDLSHNLKMSPGEVKCITYNFVPLASDVGNEIQLSYVSLTLGSENTDNRVINLRFSGKWNESDMLLRNDSYLLSHSKEKTQFYKLEPKLSIQIKSKVSKLQFTLEHKPPSLISEWYPVEVVIRNEEASLCKKCVLQVTLSMLSASSVATTPDNLNLKSCTEVYENINNEPSQLPCIINIGDIEVGEIRRKTLYFKTGRVETRNILFKILYNTVNVAGEEIACSKEENIQLDTVNVFEVTASFLSIKCEHVSKIYANEPILMRMQVDCVSPWPVFVENTTFTLQKEQVCWDNEKSSSCLQNKILRNKEIGAEVISFTVKNSVEENFIPLGVFYLYWRRENDDKEFTVCTEVQLPQVKVEKLPVYVDIDISSPGWVRTPMPLKMVLQNNSDELMSFDVSVEHNELDAFMFSGCKQMSFNIIPGGKHPVYYNLFPLQAGNIPLPYIKLTIHSDLISQTDLSDLVKRSLPTSLFVMPQRKGNEANINCLMKKS